MAPPVELKSSVLRPKWSFEKALRHLKGLGRSFLDLCFPIPCAGCGRKWLLHHEGFWCESCLEKIPWISSPICPQCGRPFPKSPSSPDHLCGDCLLSTFSFDYARSAVQHAGIVRDRIHQLKFGGHLHWVPALAELLLRTIEREKAPRAQIIVPVPLHVKRVRERGFNQAALIAGVMARRLGVPVRFDVLVRRFWTAPQTRLNRSQRLENVKGAFQVSLSSEIRGRIVLMIDDVFTTGTTLNECAKVLKESGAAEIHALTVSRALPDWKKSYDDSSSFMDDAL